MTFGSRTFAGAFTIVALTVVSACATDGGTTGALDNTSSRTDCAPEDDACLEGGLDAPLAVGARVPVDVRITAGGVASPKITSESARSDVLVTEGNTLVGVGTGWSSVLFVTEDGVVLDFVTVRVVKPERLELYRRTASGSTEPTPLPERIQLAVGDDVELAAKTFAGATRLVGDVPVDWTISGASADGTPVALMLDGGRPASRRLRTKAPGTAVVHASATTFEKAIVVEVLP